MRKGKKPTRDQLAIELAEARQLISELQQTTSDNFRIENAIRGSEERYRHMVENAHDVLWVFDLNLGYTYVSPSVRRLRGYSAQEAMQQRLEDVMTPDSYARAKELFERELALEMTGQRHGAEYSFTSQFELIRKDGTTFWAEITVSPLYDASGQPKGIFGITRDISERKKAEEELRLSEDRFRTLIQKSLDIILLLDSSGRITYETPSIQSILGYEPGRLIGCSPLEFVHPIDLKTVAHDLDEVFQKTNPGIPTEFRFRKADGTWIFLEAIGQNLLEDPAIGAIVLTARDITERKRKEEALRESEQRFSAIFENAADGMLLVDIDTGRFLMGNRQMCEALGYGPEELRTLSVQDIHPQQDLPYVMAQIKKQISGTLRVARDIPVQRKDGSVYYADINSFVIPLMDKTPLLGIFRDITERREAEEELRNHRDHLDDLVRERTTRLIHVNERLKQEIEDRKQAEEALHMSEEIYRIHFSLSNDVLFTSDEEFRIKSVTPNVERILGYAPRELVGGFIPEMNILHPDDLEKAMNDALNVLAGGDSRHPVFRFIAKDGKIKFGEVSGVPLVKKGRGTSLISVARDVTERIEREQSMVEILERSRTHFSLTNDVMFTFNHRFRITSVSPNLERTSGYTPEELMAKPMYELGLLAPEYLEEGHDNALHLLSGQTIQSMIYEFILKDGSRRFVEVSGSPLMRGGRVAEVVCVVREITHQLDHEKFLQETKATAQALLNACTDFMVLTDSTGTILHVNKAASENLGRNTRDLLGTCIFNHLPNDVARRRKVYFDQVISTGRPMRFRDENGKRVLHTSLFPVQNINGKVTRIAIFAQEMNQLK